ncbi:MAG: hypothetical protein BRD41_01990, partial [Bacteroidetes bacterium QS_1_63_11]
MDRDAAKRATAEAAVHLVEDGMCLGLGSGSTTAYALEFLGRRIRNNDLDVRGVATSFATERRAHAHGIPLTSFDDTPTLDLAIDGAVKVAEEVASIGCRVVLVANLTDPKDAHAREEIHALEEMADLENLNAEIFQLAIPRNDKYMREAEEKGVPIWDLPHANRTHTGKALRAFCEW